MSAIGFSGEMERAIHESGHEFSLNRTGFFLNETNPRFIYVCANAAVFNAHTRKAAPVESTVKSCQEPANQKT